MVGQLTGLLLNAYSGPVRLSTNNDVLHGLDGAYDFHPGFCAVVADPGLG